MRIEPGHKLCVFIGAYPHSVDVIFWDEERIEQEKSRIGTQYIKYEDQYLVVWNVIEEVDLPQS